MKTISIKSIRDNTVKLNQFALTSSEKIVLKTIDTLEVAQTLTDKRLQKTIAFSEKRQDAFFSSLEKGKELFGKKIPKLLTTLSKN